MSGGARIGQTRQTTAFPVLTLCIFRLDLKRGQNVILDHLVFGLSMIEIQSSADAASSAE